MNELIQIGPISPMCQRLIDDMTMRRCWKETQRNYLRDVARFASRLAPILRAGSVQPRWQSLAPVPRGRSRRSRPFQLALITRIPCHLPDAWTGRIMPLEILETCARTSDCPYEEWQKL